MADLLLLLLILREKDETPDIEDLGSVLHDSSIQTLHLSTKKCTHADGPLKGSYKIIGGATYQGGFFAGGTKDRTGV